MPRKRTTDPAPSAPVEPASSEAVEPVNPEAKAEEPANPKAVNASDLSPSKSEPGPSLSSEPEPKLQPAEFSRDGRTMICTVCGTEARLDFDQQLFCPNAHNHPPLATETANS